jgi:hypothetical protein
LPIASLVPPHRAYRSAKRPRHIGLLGKVRIPMKPAMHSKLKPATRSDLKPAIVPI